MHSIALVRRPGTTVHQEGDRTLILLYGNAVVSHSGEDALQISELMVVGGEDGLAFDALMQVLGYGPGQGQAVEGACPPAHLIQEGRLFLVAEVRMWAISVISTMNVLCPADRSSYAPTPGENLVHR